MNNICTPIRERFSAYLDGDINGLEMQQIAAHLETCPSCRTEFAQWQSIQRALSAARLSKPPVDLALRLRIALSHERANADRTLFSRLRDQWELYRDNTLRPFAVKGIAASAVIALVLGFGLFSAVAVPPTVEANDEPLAGFSNPHFLYSAQGTVSDTGLGSDTPLVVEALVNSQGRVYDYRIISGKQDIDTTTRLREQMVHAVFQPAQALGVAVRGRVLLTYADVSVSIRG